MGLTSGGDVANLTIIATNVTATLAVIRLTVRDRERRANHDVQRAALRLADEAAAAWAEGDGARAHEMLHQARRLIEAGRWI